MRIRRFSVGSCGRVSHLLAARPSGDGAIKIEARLPHDSPTCPPLPALPIIYSLNLSLLTPFHHFYSASSLFPVRASFRRAHLSMKWRGARVHSHRHRHRRRRRSNRSIPETLPCDFRYCVILHLVLIFVACGVEVMILKEFLHVSHGEKIIVYETRS